MIETITATIIATIIAAVIVEVIFHGIKKESLASYAINLFKHLFLRNRSLVTHKVHQDLLHREEAISTLLSYIKDDQDQSGPYRGQFGRGERPNEEKRYLVGLEHLNTKPRLYSTGWPVFVLVKYKEQMSVNSLLKTAKSGVSDLFHNDWVYIGMGARRYTSPVDSHGGGTVISYRHTIRAAQILLAIDHTLPLVRTVLGKMLDRTTDMQTQQGAWRQCNIEFRAADLFASAYAIGFLYSCKQQASILNLNSMTVDKINMALDQSFFWLYERWKADGWKYGEIPVEENAPILFCEIAAAAAEHCPSIVVDVLSHFESCLDVLGQPSSSYLDALGLPGLFSASIRLAYAFFMNETYCKSMGRRWVTLVEYALRHLTNYNCVDAAMMLDILMFSRNRVA